VVAPTQRNSPRANAGFNILPASIAPSPLPDGAMDAGNMLKPALARGELRCVGATTLDEYRQYRHHLYLHLRVYVTHQ
jgi:hypothetical protein